MTIGHIQALFNIIVSSRGIIIKLSNVHEKLRVARFVITEIADLLNECRDEEKRTVEHAKQQLNAVKAACKKTSQQEYTPCMTFYRGTYTGGA